ncbi:MAG: lysophospholipid acyltransferase family protein [Pseudomonadota bacterium]
MRIITSYAYLAFLALSVTLVGILCLPLMANKGVAIKIAKLWAQMNLGAARWLCGIKSEIRGKEHLAVSPAILAAKHQSMWETLRLMAELPAACFVLKKELKNIPMFGWWCQAVGFIFIDREAGAKALRSMLMDASEALEEGASHIIIFPEGTRAAPGSSAPYQPGVAALAKSLRLPIIPAAHNSGSYWKTPGPEKVPGTIVMEVFPPLPTDLDRQSITTELERTIENAVRRLEANTEAHSNPAGGEGRLNHGH